MVLKALVSAKVMIIAATLMTVAMVASRIINLENDLF